MVKMKRIRCDQSFQEETPTHSSVIPVAQFSSDSQLSRLCAEDQTMTKSYSTLIRRFHDYFIQHVAIHNMDILNSTVIWQLIHSIQRLSNLYNTPQINHMIRCNIFHIMALFGMNTEDGFELLPAVANNSNQIYYYRGNIMIMFSARELQIEYDRFSQGTDDFSIRMKKFCTIFSLTLIRKWCAINNIVYLDS